MQATSIYAKGAAALIALSLATWLIVERSSNPTTLIDEVERPALVPVAAIYVGDWILCEDGAPGSFTYACTVWSDSGAVRATGVFAYLRNGAASIGPAASDLTILAFRDGRILVEDGHLEPVAS